MTTIAYYNGVLASDRRVTTTGFDDGAICHHCGKTTHVIETIDDKISSVKGSTASFMGMDIIAIGQSGNLIVGKRLIDALLRGKNIEEMVEDYYELTMRELESATLLIVCKQATFTFEVTKTGSSINKHGTSNPVAIGTGAMAAMTAMKIMNADAITAVIIAMDIDIYSGNGVMKLDLSKPNSEVVRVHPDEIHDMMNAMQKGNESATQ